MRYIVDKLGWVPWEGTEENPGQVEALRAYELALRQLHERDAWEQGELHESQLKYWRPGETIKNRIRIEAGHTVGKTKVAGGFVSHFFDTCAPSIIYTFAPSSQQVNDLLWKEIRTDRNANPELPGRVLDGKPAINYKSNHFAKGVATSDAHGRGTERVQGQHGKYLMFVLDEAEGVADYVWDAVESMTSGGVAIVLMLANPRTRTSRFYKQRLRSDVANFRISCIGHPNVIQNREVVPGAVRRDYVVGMLQENAEIVPEHDDDAHTFALPFDAFVGDRTAPAGTIFRPNSEYMFRVLGIAPGNMADDTFFPSGRYEAALHREPDGSFPHIARMGIDAARYGSDMGTLYIRHGGRVWRERQFAQLDGHAYYVATKEAARALRAQGVTDLQIRVDASGGYGNAVIDFLNHDPDLGEWFQTVDPDTGRPRKTFQVVEVYFGASPDDVEAYDNLITELYADAAETIKGVSLMGAPTTLEEDLTERKFKWVNKSGRAVKRLSDKEQFRKDKGRSPDDGDGFVLCTASDHLVGGVTIVSMGAIYGSR